MSALPRLPGTPRPRRPRGRPPAGPAPLGGPVPGTPSPPRDAEAGPGRLLPGEARGAPRIPVETPCYHGPPHFRFPNPAQSRQAGTTSPRRWTPNSTRGAPTHARHCSCHSGGLPTYRAPLARTPALTAGSHPRTVSGAAPTHGAAPSSNTRKCTFLQDRAVRAGGAARLGLDS